MTSQDPTLRAAVVFRSGLGVRSWEARNAVSPVPAQWPYGLDKLQGHGLDVEAVELESPGRFRKLVRSLGRLRSHAGEPSAVSVALCWDEMTGALMRDGITADRYFSGVIWATDQLHDPARESDLERLARVLRELDGLWVLSLPQVSAVQDWLGEGCPPVHFVRFGIDSDFYAFQPYPDRPHIVSVGGDRDRDPATLFEALTLVLDARPDARATVQTSSQVLPPAGVTVVRKLPHIEVAALLAQATVVAIPTRPNLHASGMTVGLEAMSVGRPVVVCDTPGMRDDYFTEGVDSFLVPTGSPSDLADRILTLLDDPSTAASMGERGRKRVVDLHSTDRMCAEIAALVKGR